MEPAVVVAASLLNEADRLEGVMLGSVVVGWREAGLGVPSRPLWRAVNALDAAVSPKGWELKEGDLADEKTPVTARGSLGRKWLSGHVLPTVDRRYGVAR